MTVVMSAVYRIVIRDDPDVRLQLSMTADAHGHSCERQRSARYRRFLAVEPADPPGPDPDRETTVYGVVELGRKHSNKYLG